MARPLNEYGITVSKGPSRSVPSAVLYIKKDAADTLLQYPRRELIFMTEEGDGTAEEPDRHFIAVIPESSTDSGRQLSKDPNRSGAYRSSVLAHELPTGRYTMNPEPEYIDGVDWFELTPEIQ